ncbi:HEAT repeat protein [Gimesia alba]|uniref:HEAT repeat protein n=1 Tax=Gimesia alba TaxID=2527973 RepID=A0A517RIM1_9PLAN|nr:HEAT repeat domain-containing protein [Gimesia alba]QDT43724.1 HEAT repeat protein [Gimesia alba]
MSNPFPENDSTHTESQLQLLYCALTDPDLLRSQWATEQLELQVCGEEETKLLLQSMRADEPEKRWRAINICVQLALDGSNVVPHLLTTVKDRLWTIREASALALAPHVSDDQVHQALLDRALFDKSPLVREAALRGLSGTLDKHRQTLDALLAALKHPKPPVRCRAAVGLTYFRTAACFIIPDLTEALNDSHRKVRLAATNALAQFGPQAISALPTLIRRRFEGDFTIKQAAVKAIAAILPGASAPLRRTLTPSLEWFDGPQQTLQDAFKDYELPEEVRAQFIEECQSQIDVFTKQNPEQSPVSENKPDGWQAACAVVRAAEQSGRSFDEKKEYTKLLARFVELWLDHNTKEK